MSFTPGQFDPSILAEIDDNFDYSSFFSQDPSPEGTPEDGQIAPAEQGDEYGFIDDFGDETDHQEAPPTQPQTRGQQAQKQPDPQADYQKQLRDLQAARAGAQRKLAEEQRQRQALEQRLAEFERQAEEQQIQLGAQYLAEKVKDLEPAQQQAAFAQYQAAITQHRTQRQQTQLQQQTVRQQREADAQSIAMQMGVDPQTGQPYVTPQELLQFEFPDTDRMAQYAGIRAGFLDQFGNPTPKLYQAVQAQQQGSLPQYQQPMMQPQGNAPQSQALQNRTQQRRAQRGNDNFPTGQSVSAPPQEPKTIEEGMEAFMKGAAQLVNNGRRRRS